MCYVRESVRASNSRAQTFNNNKTTFNKSKPTKCARHCPCHYGYGGESEFPQKVCRLLREQKSNDLDKLKIHNFDLKVRKDQGLVKKGHGNKHN